LIELICSAIGIVRPTAETKGVQLSFKPQPPADSFIVRSDRVRVGQAVTNLLSNAVKFTDEGSITVKTWIEPNPSSRTPAEPQPEMFCVSVEDTGVGIPVGNHERIFRSFEQTSEGAARGGAGLGLAVTKQVIEALGGTIDARQYDIHFHTLPEIPLIAEKSLLIEYCEGHYQDEDRCLSSRCLFVAGRPRFKKRSLISTSCMAKVAFSLQKIISPVKLYLTPSFVFCPLKRV
jgi:hypothetical protein